MGQGDTDPAPLFYSKEHLSFSSFIVIIIDYSKHQTCILFSCPKPIYDVFSLSEDNSMVISGYIIQTCENSSLGYRYV